MAGRPDQPRTDLDFAMFRELLQRQRDDLRHQLDELDLPADAAQEGSEFAHEEGMSDQATESALRDQAEAINVGLKSSLAAVEKALQRLEDGSYGRCTRCSADIQAERLEILPQTPFCIRCTAEMEGRV